MQKPLHHSWRFWIMPVVLSILGMLMVDSYFHESLLRIPRAAEKVPTKLYLESGVVRLLVEQTPDPYAKKGFSFERYPISDRRLHFMTRFYQKTDAYKYLGATGKEQSAAKAAGIRSPLLEYEFVLPIGMVITVLGMAWWFRALQRSKRMAREAMAMAVEGKPPT